MLSCAGYLQCARKCNGDSQAPFSVGACVFKCRQVVDDKTGPILFASAQCAMNWCSTANDMAAPRCESGGDPVGASVGTCRACTDNVQASIEGFSCDPNSSDCDATACASYYQLCLAN